MQLPARTINSYKKLAITRRLPVAGEVLVQRGQKVSALQVIARAEMTRRYQIIDVARQLAQPEVDMDRVLLKAAGDEVEANEAVATNKSGLPLLRRVVRAPVAGQIAAIGPGWVLLETERISIELQAFVNGTVSNIIPDRGAIIETNGAMITASCGFGGEAYGPLKRMVNAPFEAIQPERLDEAVKNRIILGGRTVDEPLLRIAEAAHVHGIIVGSIDASLLKLNPPTRVRVVATEGFGDISMSPFTFGVLGTLDNKEVSIRGTVPAPFPDTAGGVGEQPPLVMTSTTREIGRPAGATEGGQKAQPGSRVRVTRGLLLGASGAIDSISSEPQAVESGIIVPGAYVKIHGTSHYIPWANLELVT
jgi:hypothetical protein